ncbi:hypothetical protein [Blastococcus sp. LR1]|uniref:hypothetical protein n=1 Tax=Blastococcus sp. LR1 TaxID=2877000 RepID=UPI001CCA7E27|nr:hypothetical protein [Blastococcus sp. LR1]MCA0144820.1 hypothetical protein [Blastococcus sp. LR1]
MVHDGLEVVPWAAGGFHRSVLITSALARLGERGILADAIVRLCIGPLLARRVTLHVVHAMAATRRGVVDADALPRQLRGWLTAFAHLPDMDESGLLMSALTGPGIAELNQWIDEAALAHLIVWRRDAQRVQLEPADRVLPGGVDATRWIFDRFTKTRLDEWRTASLQWELAFLDRPEAVCGDAGVPVRLVAERPVSMAMVVSALARRVCAASSDAEVLAGMTASEVMQELVTLTKVGAFDAAVGLAARASSAAPASVELAIAHAFLRIVRHPGAAETELRQILRSSPGQKPLISVNIASCLLRQQGSIDQISELLGDEDVAKSDKLAWLWAPEPLIEGKLLLEEYRISDWVSEMTYCLARAR